jgi:dephospho-CoA kinase
MKIIGLTGGIGSGKTTVSQMFSKFGVPVYIADDEAKKLTNTSKIIKRKLVALLGEEAYTGSNINRKFVADCIFNNAELLKAVNAIIHPAVAKHFSKWVKKQDASYVIKEAAILFENGSYKNYDLVILVTAPLDIRIARVMARDKITKSKVEERIKNQWSDEHKKKLADIIIENIDLQTTQKQVETIHSSMS